MSLVQRLIDVTFSLASGTFDGGNNVATLSGLRVSARVIKAGGPSLGTAQLTVYGMTLEMMNRLSTLGMRVNLVPRNAVAILAGDASGKALVFEGTITNAYADFQAAPDVGFVVEAHTGLAEAVAPTPPTSYTGAVNIAVIMQSLATQMGLAFENNGVETVLVSPYFWGAALRQAETAAAACGVGFAIDDGVLAIWPKNGARGGAVPLVSPDTGMVGYPAYTAQGLALRTLFNPSIGFMGKIEVKSSLTPANGVWAVYSLAHSLDAQVPHGNWFSDLGAYNPGLLPPVITSPVTQ